MDNRFQINKDIKTKPIGAILATDRLRRLQGMKGIAGGALGKIYTGMQHSRYLSQLNDPDVMDHQYTTLTNDQINELAEDFV